MGCCEGEKEIVQRASCMDHICLHSQLDRIFYSLLTVSQGPLQVAGLSSRMASASEPCPSSSSDTGCPEEEDVVLTSVHVCYHKFESMCHQLFVLGLSAILIKLLIAVETSTSLTWEDTCHAHKHTM